MGLMLMPMGKVLRILIDVSMVPRMLHRRGSWLVAGVHLLVGLIRVPVGKDRKILGQAARGSDRLDDQG